MPIILAIISLVMFWQAIHQQLLIVCLAFLAITTLGLQLIAIIQKRIWISLAYLATVGLYITAEFLLLVIPALQGGQWSVITGINMLSVDWIIVDLILVVLPVVVITVGRRWFSLDNANYSNNSEKLSRDHPNILKH